MTFYDRIFGTKQRDEGEIFLTVIDRNKAT